MVLNILEILPLNKALLFTYLFDKVDILLHWERRGEETVFNKLFFSKADLTNKIKK